MTMLAPPYDCWPCFAETTKPWLRRAEVTGLESFQADETIQTFNRLRALSIRALISGF
jgi:hypothetical protein